MVFVVMLHWQLFATALSSIANSLVTNSNLISKVYFPGIIVAAAATSVAVTDFLISFALLCGMVVWYQFVPPIQAIAVVPLILLAALVAFGLGLILCALNVPYRDFRIIVPFIIQFGLYISPVGFPSGIIPEKWRLLYECNPMVGGGDGFRGPALGAMDFPQLALSISRCCVVFFLLVGIKVFRKTERTFSGVI